MSHDKISAAARKRMAETGETYAAARRAVIGEHAARTQASGRQFFELKYRDAGLDRLGLWTDRFWGGGPGLSGATVGAGEIQIRVPGFTLDIPRESAQSAERSYRNLRGATGVHGGRGKWLVNGAPDGLVDITISPPAYTGRSLATGFRRAAVRFLTLSLVDPESFINAVSLRTSKRYRRLKRHKKADNCGLFATARERPDMWAKRKSLVAAGVAVGLAGGTLLFASSAQAASNLTVTLSASGTGASAVWNSSQEPVLTVGSTSGTYAEIEIDNVPAAAPTSAPSFVTNNYSNGSPRWQIQFADGDTLYGYPAQGSSGWQVVPGGTGTCADETDGVTTYVAALAFIQNIGCGGNVTSAAIVANGNQAAGTADTITDVTYDGEGIVAGADVVTVTSPGSQTSTAGTAITTLQIAASSSNGYSITSYGATGLPPGLTINASTGAITGTPTTAGNYSVTVTATDSNKVQGSVSFAWLVNPSSSTGTPGTTTYTGSIKLVKLGLCLDDQNNSSTPGAIVQVWGCNGLTNQVWEVESNGTIQHNGLCLDAKHSGSASGTKVQLWTCTGANNQLWNTTGWRIHYDNPAASNEVLDDTGWGHAGTQQDIWTNNGGANQVWATS
jgi:hypothetical protein